MLKVQYAAKRPWQVRKNEPRFPKQMGVRGLVASTTTTSKIPSFGCFLLTTHPLSDQINSRGSVREVEPRYTACCYHRGERDSIIASPDCELFRRRNILGPSQEIDSIIKQYPECIVMSLLYGAFYDSVRCLSSSSYEEAASSVLFSLPSWSLSSSTSLTLAASSSSSTTLGQP
jgi:hypothetical protein